MRATAARLGAIIATCWVLNCAHAQTVDLWPGAAPGSEKWTYVEKNIPSTPYGAAVMNVVKPTLTAFLPEKSKATGTAVIIAPGGAFVRLAIDQEGRDVARWLQNRGVAAFVLKYRLMEDRPGMPSMQDMDKASTYAVADGIQALKVLCRHAGEWGVASDKIGFMGRLMRRPDPTSLPCYMAVPSAARRACQLNSHRCSSPGHRTTPSAPIPLPSSTMRSRQPGRNRKRMSSRPVATGSDSRSKA
jgi:hypothetical protein